LETLATLGFSEMTPVQASAIPLFMKNKDVVIEVCSKDIFIIKVLF
jgi:ATP-dependent RNA helicase DDX55/SPB4